jgi:dihydroorotate dehydrogenase electron transfer subunit
MVEEAWVLAKAPIIENRAVGPDVYRMTFHAPAMSQAARPGQFVNVSCSKTYAPLLRRPFSLNRIDMEKGNLSILYKVVGEGTRLLTDLRQGEEIDVLGPLGNGFAWDTRCRDSILIAGGIGVAPFYPLAQTLVEKGQTVTCLVGARCREEIHEMLELISLGVEVICATDDGSEGHHGLVTELLSKHLSGTPCSMAYACGPNAMLAAVKAVCKEYETPLQVSLESHMACGLGVCLGCTCGKEEGEGYWHVCSDGPVFWAEGVKL